MAKSRRNELGEVFEGRRRWTAQEAQTVLDAAARSGMSLMGFATQQGLCPERLYRWRKLLGGAVPASGVGLQEISLRQAPVFQEGWEPQPIEVLLRSGRVVRVRSSFDEDALRRLMVVLEDGTC